MSASLLVISIGPIQDFIASARRTRDLWFGSTLLSEISKAAARAIVERCGVEALVFPAPESGGLLKPDSDFNVANVILARVENPEAVFRVAKEGALSRWREFAAKALAKASKELKGLENNSGLWESQVEDAIECYGAWTSIEAGGYAEARKRVMRLLAARKQCRDFRPNMGRGGVPKSSLDGLRESVIHCTGGSLRLGIKENEELCAVGLTKRLGGGTKRFPSVSRVAVDPWVRAVCGADSFEGTWCELLETCGKLEDLGLVSGLDENGPYGDFPYEGAILLESRLRDLEKEKNRCEDPESARDQIAKLRRILKRFRAKGEPFPYLAVLSADGDRMGQTISYIDKPEKHMEFSRDLSRFAGKARQIVRDFRGICIYSGGDDVLAFVPLDTALSCARKLREDFVDRLKTWGDKEGKSPTLSVGIAVGHVMEDLADLLNFAREAEKLAKGNDRDGKTRDGLAVVVRARGNEACSVRERWDPGDGNPSLDERLALWSRLQACGDLPSKMAYELRQTAEFYRVPQEALIEESTRVFAEEALKKDAMRIFGRKEVHLGKEEKKAVKDRIGLIESPQGLADFSSELIIGQWLAAGTRREKGGKEPCRLG